VSGLIKIIMKEFAQMLLKHTSNIK